MAREKYQRFSTEEKQIKLQYVDERYKNLP